MAMQAAARPVHPHMRGVYEGFKLDDTPHYGSSPRAWGLPLSNAEICCDCRSIPTYVGFTSKNRRTASHRSGPSPHTWGLLLRRKRPLDPGRSIPTYVGFTSKNRRTASHRSGPSPHTWGLLLRRKRPLDPGRSIPTYVGFTLEPPLYHSLLAGPSPHTWGLLIDLIYQILHVRSIPTYVGFTSSESRVTKIPSVHPHIRGVYKRVLGDIGCAPGPSPHTWGLLLDSLQRESQ